jgi:hypothetical protein
VAELRARMVKSTALLRDLDFDAQYFLVTSYHHANGPRAVQE